MTFNEICALEDRLIKELGAKLLLAEFIARMEWSDIGRIYTDIDEFYKNKNNKKGGKK